MTNGIADVDRITTNTEIYEQCVGNIFTFLKSGIRNTRKRCETIKMTPWSSNTLNVNFEYI